MSLTNFGIPGAGTGVAKEPELSPGVSIQPRFVDNGFHHGASESKMTGRHYSVAQGPILDRGEFFLS